MSVIFISDLHLDNSRSVVINYFVNYIKNLNKSVESIYILGDFLEYWVGDDDPAQGLNEVFEVLKLQSKNINISLMHGNRDFLLSKNYCKKYGIELISDPTIIDLYGKKVLLMHGDTLCTDDIKYQEFRKLVRSRQWQDNVLSRSLEERLNLAKTLRVESAKATKVKDEYIMDVNQDAVVKVINEYDVDVIIHGHTHRPNIHNITIDDKNIKRIVLGDWYDKTFILNYDEDNIKIEKTSLISQRDHSS